MSSAYLQLQLNGLSVKLEQFFSGNLPRIEATVETGQTVAYTASGGVTVAGPTFEAYSLWTVDAPCTIEQYETLKLIKLESEHRRRTNGNPNILVYDTTQLHQERSPRTRAIVPGTTVRIVDSYLFYFAQYNALITSLEWRQFGRGYAVAFTMQETGKVAA